MNGLLRNNTLIEETTMTKIRGVGLNCLTLRPNRTTYALETWHIYPDRKVLAAIRYGTKAEVTTKPGLKYRSKRHAEYGARSAGCWKPGHIPTGTCKGYLTLRDQFDTEVDYLRYARSVSIHPARIDKRLEMEVRE